MFKVYVACHQGNDGRDCGVIARFVDRPAAEQAIKGRGPMGYGDGFITEEIVYEDAADYQENSPENLRKKALAKLTDIEKKVLGLKES